MSKWISTKDKFPERLIMLNGACAHCYNFIDREKEIYTGSFTEFRQMFCNKCLYLLKITKPKEPNMLKLEVGKTYLNGANQEVKIVAEEKVLCLDEPFIGFNLNEATFYWYEENGNVHCNDLMSLVKEHKPLHKHKCEFYVNFCGWGDPFEDVLIDIITNADVKNLEFDSEARYKLLTSLETAIKDRSGAYNRTLKVTVISEEVEE